MATITLRIPDDDLANIDAIAGRNNRTQFMLNAAREAASRIARERLDAEVGRLLAENADEDLDIAADWAATAGDGIE